MHILTYIISSVVIVSLIAFVGIFSLAISRKILQKVLFALVSFAAGAMLTAAFLDLIPHALEHAPAEEVFIAVMLGIVAFFIMETFLFWYHSHENGHKSHAPKHKKTHRKMPVVYLNLIGDGVHNFLDGVIIAVAYLASVPLGIITTLAVVFHEIPQEIGDFGVLIYGGFKRAQALFFNFLSALTAILGAVAAYYLGTVVEHAVEWLVPFAAGGFLYIAAVDLLPELKKTKDFKKAVLQLVFFGLGMAVIWITTKLFIHAH